MYVQTNVKHLREIEQHVDSEKKAQAEIAQRRGITVTQLLQERDSYIRKVNRLKAMMLHAMEFYCYSESEPIRARMFFRKEFYMSKLKGL